MSRSKLECVRCGAILFLFLTYGMAKSPDLVIADSGGQEWSTPLVLSTNEQASDPYLTRDSHGVMHAVWGGVSDPAPRSYTDTIYYTHWSDNSWGQPIDIFFSHKGENTRYPVIAAANDTLHIIWVGGMENVYYSRVSSCSSGNVRAWAEPHLLVDDNVHVSRVGMKSATDGSLHLVYAQSTGVSSIIVYSRSDDNGVTWSPPVSVSKYDSNVLVWLPVIELDAAGRLHATWSKIEAGADYGALGVGYARSLDGGQSWSTPIEMAGKGYGRSNLLSIGSDEVHIVWSGTVGYDGRYHRWSSDGGETWSNEDQLPAVKQSFGGGFNGMVADSTGALHLVAGVEYMTYLSWHRGQWISAERIWEVDYSYGDPVTEGGMSRIALFGDNRLISLWHDNWRIFFATKLLNSEPTELPETTTCETPVVAEPLMSRAPAAGPISLHATTNPMPGEDIVSREHHAGICPVASAAIPTLALVLSIVLRRVLGSRSP